MGCHALLQGIFPTRGWNLHLLRWQAGSSPPSYRGSPPIARLTGCAVLTLPQAPPPCSQSYQRRPPGAQTTKPTDSGLSRPGPSEPREHSPLGCPTDAAELTDWATVAWIAEPRVCGGERPALAGSQGSERPCLAGGCWGGPTFPPRAL